MVLEAFSVVVQTRCVQVSKIYESAPVIVVVGPGAAS